MKENMVNNDIDFKALRTKVVELVDLMGFDVIERGPGLDAGAEVDRIKESLAPVNPFTVGLEFIGLDEDDNQMTLESEFKDAGVHCNPAQQAWCGAFADLVRHKCGYSIVGSLAARDFEDQGQVVENPEPGDFACWRNHIAIFAGYADKAQLAKLEAPFKVESITDWQIVKTDVGEPMVLGGNQSDMVNISPKRWYDRYSKFLGYRRVIV